MYYWMSFADTKKPKGTQFLGALMIEGKDVTAALKASCIMGINPGGQIKIAAFEAMDTIGQKLIDEWKEKLLSRYECEKLDSLIAGHIRQMDA